MALVVTKMSAGSAIVLALSMQATLTMAQDGAVSPQAIQSTWVGKTVIATLAGGAFQGKSVKFTMAQDGTVSMEGALVDTGNWRLSEQGYCVTWKKIRAGQERCFTVVRKGSDQLVINPDGSISTTVTEIR